MSTLPSGTGQCWSQVCFVEAWVYDTFCRTGRVVTQPNATDALGNPHRVLCTGVVQVIHTLHLERVQLGSSTSVLKSEVRGCVPAMPGAAMRVIPGILGCLCLFLTHPPAESSEVSPEPEVSLLQVHQKGGHEEVLGLVPAPKWLSRKEGFLEISNLTVDVPPALLPVIQDFLGPAARVAASSPAMLQLRQVEWQTPPAVLEGCQMKEGYMLNISQQIIIEAPSEHGLFNGLMTLRQLLSRSSGSIYKMPRVQIVDAPVFAWRGVMLDVSRHFFNARDVKHLLKTMALFKLNHFHWHLIDDQGWRFPVAKYPNLIRLGAYRRNTPLGHNARSDMTPYNHSYTAEEIQEVLSFAESLHIEVLPEFDLPGHTEAAIAAYPEMGNFDTSEPWKPEVATLWGALQYTLSPSEKAVNFTKDVLDEMVQLFKSSPYIHIGGDEVPTRQWKGSLIARGVAEKNHIPVSALESYMLQKASNHLQSLHRNAVVWDDALENPGALPRETAVILWRDSEGIDRLGNLAAKDGHSVILAPGLHAYFDKWQNAQHSHFDAIGGFLPLEKVYDFPTKAGNAEILGMQGQVWTEYIREGLQNLDYMTWPRGCALAEVAWSGDQRPGFADFQIRLRQRQEDFKAFDVYVGEL